MFGIIFYQLMQLVYFVSVKTAAVLKPNGIKPKLSLTIFSLDMNVGRFTLITSIKKEAIRPIFNTVGILNNDRV
jgi:hypothetical protein